MGISLNPDHLKRYKDMALLLIKYGRKDIVDEAGLSKVVDSSDVKNRDVPEDIEQLPKDLEELGPTYIKLGQFLSTRSDILPGPYLDALSRLQDGVKSFPFADVEKIITSELGIRFSKAFKNFDPKPIGAASLGQVHKAVLNDDRQVVVKVQRPGIIDNIMKDLDALGDIAEFLQKHTKIGKEYAIETIFKEFRKMLLRELDYTNEVQNLITVRNNLKEFKNIIIPSPVEDYSTSKVITMDYISGDNITAFSPLRFLDVDGKKLAKELFEAYMKQIVIDGIYHSDPHPGNVFLTQNNKIALLDLGMVSYISGGMQIRLLEILIALGDGRGDDVATYVEDISRKTDSFNKEEFRSSISEFISAQKSVTLENLKIGKVLLEITSLCGKNGLFIPDELSMLGKTLLNLDKIGKTLDPDFNPNKAIRQKAEELLKKKLTQEAQSKKPYEILLEGKEFFERLPERVNKIFDKLANNELSFKVETINEQYLMNGFQKIANRITLGLIIAAMIIGAALIMNINTGFTIFGYPGIAILLFFAAAFAGCTLAFRILFTDEQSPKKE